MMTTRQWKAIARERLMPFLGGPPDAEFLDELAAHLMQAYEESRGDGRTDDESRAAAMAVLHDSSPWIEAARERGRRAERGGLLPGLGIGRDIRHALRMLVRTPAFSIIAILTFAVGIGANTAIFSVVDGVLLRALPYPDPDRITMVWLDNRRENIKEDITSYPNYRDWRDQNQSYAYLAAYSETAFALTGAGEAERLYGAQVTTNFFDVIGVKPAMGRLFTAVNETEGQDALVLISHGLWQRRFGGAPDIVGKTITLSTRVHEIIGVMPPDMRWPERAEFWKPLAPVQAQRESRGSFWLPVIGRLKPGVTIEAAQTEMAGISTRLEQAFPSNRGYGANVVRLRDQMVGGIERALKVLMGAVGFVLLIACANLANLMLGRTAARRRELAIRTALGAGRARLIRQIVTEALVLASIGGAAGIALAWWAAKAFVALAGNTIPAAARFGLDARVLGFAFVIATLAALLSSLLPALHASRAAIGNALREGGRQGGPTGSRRTRNVLVGAEVALALMLLTGAGLLLRTLWGMQAVDRGFIPERVAMATVSLPGTTYRTPEDIRAFYRRFIEKVRAVPGVESAALTTGVLMPLLANSGGFSFEGKPTPPPDQRPEYPFEFVSPGFFETIGAKMAAGREFTEQDHERAPQVAIVNETLARSVWPNEDPIGKRLRSGDGADGQPWATVVGVVKDLRRGDDVKRRVRPEIYASSLQVTPRTETLLVRTAGDPTGIMSSVRRELQAIDAQLPLFRVTTLEAQLSATLSQPRFQATVLGGFGVIALLLAAVGIYGVTSHAVGQRTQEVGIRMAMGAGRREVRLLILRQHVMPALVGVGIGLAGAIALSRLLTSLLYGVGAVDPVTYAVVAISLITVAVAACWVPANRAMRVDPLIALRAD
jgi:putative ABC transport system permease protein